MIFEAHMNVVFIVNVKEDACARYMVTKTPRITLTITWNGYHILRMQPNLLNKCHWVPIFGATPYYIPL